VRRQLGRSTRRLTLGIVGPVEAAAARLSGRDEVRDLTAGVGMLSFDFDGDDEAQADLVEALVRDRVRIRSLEERRSSLEDLLVDIAAPGRTA